MGLREDGIMARQTVAKRRPRSKSGASRLHEDAILIDGQGVAVLLPVAQISQPPADGKPFLDRLVASGVTAMNVTLGIGGIGMGVDDLRALLNTIHSHYCYFELEADRLLHVLTARDITRAKREGKVGIIFGVQGLPSKIDNDPSLLRILHRLGLRIVQLTYNERNTLGCGCLETPDTGLTQLGRICLREMNHLGMAVDLAHAGERTTQEAIDFSAQPIVISHANARALNDHPRNASDATLKMLAARGGVVGISTYAPFCETRPGVRPTLEDYIDHIGHIADLVGPDHVGIGSDFFEAESPIRFEHFFRVRYPDIVGAYTLETVYAKDFVRVDRFPQLTEALARRGFSAGDIRKVLGLNFLRVFRATFKG